MRDQSMEFLADPSTTMGNLAVLAVIFTPPSEKHERLHELHMHDRFTFLRLVSECLFCIKADQLDLTRQGETGKVVTPISTVRECAEHWAGKVGLEPEIADELIDHLVYKVLSPPRQRDTRSVLPDGTHGAKRNLPVGVAGMDGITLSEDLILALGRMDDTLMDSNAKKLTFAEYQLKMAIENGKVEGVNESLRSIQVAIGEQAKRLRTRIENVKLDFYGQDYQALNEKLLEDSNAFSELIGKMKEHRKAIEKMAEADAEERLDTKGEIEKGMMLIKRCLDGLHLLVTLTNTLSEEMIKGAKPGDELRRDDLFDFRSEVKDKLGTMSISQAADLGRAMLSPAMLWQAGGSLVPAGLFASTDPRPVKPAEEGFVDMSSGPALEAAADEEEEGALDTGAAAAAIMEYLTAHGGQATLKELYDDQRAGRHLLMSPRAVRRLFLGDGLFNGNGGFEPISLLPAIDLYGVGDATDITIRIKEDDR